MNKKSKRPTAGANRAQATGVVSERQDQRAVVSVPFIHEYTENARGVNRPKPRRGELVHISHLIEEWLDKFQEAK